MSLFQEIQDITQQAIPQINLNISQQKICRICLSNETNDYLIAPCKCSGSIKFIHQKCLLQWVKKSKTKTQRISTFQWATKCQLCHQRIGLLGQINFKCNNKDKIIESISKSERIYLFLLVLHLLNIALFAFLLTLTNQFETFQVFLSLLYSTSVVGLGFLILLAWTVTVFKLFIHFQIKLCQVKKTNTFENIYSQAVIFPQ